MNSFDFPGRFEFATRNPSASEIFNASHRVGGKTSSYGVFKAINEDLPRPVTQGSKKSTKKAD